MKTAYFILGMHRSGTSALGGVLSLMGLEFGTELMKLNQDNPKGYFENNFVFQLNNRILTEHKSDWNDFQFKIENIDSNLKEFYIDNAKKIIEKEFNYTNKFAIKDPRICILFPIWEEACKRLGIDIKVIIPYRSPLEVARSIQKRDAYSIESGMLSWVQHLLFAEFYSRNYERMFLSFDRLIDNMEETLEEIASFIDIKLNKNTVLKIQSFLDSNLKHNNHDIKNFSTQVPFFLKDSINLLEEKRFDDYNQFDVIREEFLNVLKIFKFLTIENKSIEEELQNKIILIKDKDIHIENIEHNFTIQQSNKDKLEAFLAIFKSTVNDSFGPIEKNSRGIGKVTNLILTQEKRKLLRADIYKLKYNLEKLNRLDNEILNALDIDNYSILDNELEDIDTKKRLEHFIFFGMDEVRLGKRSLYRNLPIFSEAEYIEKFEDIKNAIERKELNSAFDHFLKRGSLEILKGDRVLNEKNPVYHYVEPIINEDIHKEIQLFKKKPLISIIIPVYNVDSKWLELALKSIKNQWYKNWEVCIADDKSTKQETIKFLENIDDKKIKVKFLKENLNISGASNEALSMASGEYVALMDNDDEITPDALYEVVKAINEQNAEFVYSDEDKLDMDGRYTEPHFKPDYAPDMLMSQNYMSHLGVIKKSLVDEVGGWTIGLEGAQDYDLYLKVLELTDKIVHIPKVLYHWRKIPGSTAAEFSDKSYAQDAGIKSLENAISRRKLSAKVENGKYPGTYRVRYNIIGKPLVSIVIPFKDKPELLDMCINSILNKSTYQNYEIIGISNNSEEKETFEMMQKLKLKDNRVSFYEYNKPFNYSEINNYAVNNYTKGEYIVLLNNDIEIISSEWLEALLELSQKKGSGVVGAKLYYPNETIQHAGVIVGIGGVAGHSHKYFSRNDIGYFSRLHIIQNLSAVTAACFMVKKDIYKEVGGLNEEELKVAFNDVDFCLRVQEKGYYNIFTPYCEAYHHESISRGAEDNHEKIERFNTEVAYMLNRHNRILDEGDKFYNKNLTLDHENFELKE